MENLSTWRSNKLSQRAEESSMDMVLQGLTTELKISKRTWSLWLFLEITLDKKVKCFKSDLIIITSAQIIEISQSTFCTHFF